MLTEFIDKSVVEGASENYMQECCGLLTQSKSHEVYGLFEDCGYCTTITIYHQQRCNQKSDIFH